MAKANVAGLTFVSAGIVLFVVMLLVMVACDSQAQTFTSDSTFTGNRTVRPGVGAFDTTIVYDGYGNTWIVTETPSVGATHVQPGAWNTSPSPWTSQPQQAPIGPYPLAPTPLNPSGPTGLNW